MGEQGRVPVHGLSASARPPEVTIVAASHCYRPTHRYAPLQQIAHGKYACERYMNVITGPSPGSWCILLYRTSAPHRYRYGTGTGASTDPVLVPVHHRERHRDQYRNRYQSWSQPRYCIKVRKYVYTSCVMVPMRNVVLVTMSHVVCQSDTGCW